jgi:hypothetical protein
MPVYRGMGTSDLQESLKDSWGTTRHWSVTSEHSSRKFSDRNIGHSFVFQTSSPIQQIFEDGQSEVTRSLGWKDVPLLSSTSILRTCRDHFVSSSPPPMGSSALDNCFAPSCGTLHDSLRVRDILPPVMELAPYLGQAKLLCIHLLSCVSDVCRHICCSRNLCSLSNRQAKSFWLWHVVGILESVKIWGKLRPVKSNNELEWVCLSRLSRLWHSQSRIQWVPRVLGGKLRPVKSNNELKWVCLSCLSRLWHTQSHMQWVPRVLRGKLRPVKSNNEPKWVCSSRLSRLWHIQSRIQWVPGVLFSGWVLWPRKCSVTSVLSYYVSCMS